MRLALRPGRARPGGAAAGAADRRGRPPLTHEVWPWSSLVPFFVQDILARVRASLGCVRLHCLLPARPGAALIEGALFL
jgi:hypothetical protein